jgi:hypothetical protein
VLTASDRTTRTFLTAIRTLREFRGAGVNVTIGAAAQVNVADRQVAIGPTVSP